MEHGFRLFSKRRECDVLAALCEERRMPHGIIITGEKGLGKKYFARYCAMLMMCTEAAGGKPCMQCRDCRKIMKGEHPDVIYAKGEKYRKEDVRTLVQGLSVLPNDAGCRVCVFEDCDEMTAEQQNVLLKAIEEPADFNRFVFTCNDFSAVLQTIQSRLVRIPLSEMSAEECLECLLYNGMEREKAEEGIAEKGANPGAVMLYFSDKRKQEVSLAAKQAADALARLDEYGLLSCFAKAGDRAELFEMLAVLSDIICEAVSVPSPKSEAAVLLKDKISLKRLYSLFETTSHYSSLYDVNISVKIMQTECCARLFSVLL